MHARTLAALVAPALVIAMLRVSAGAPAESPLADDAGPAPPCVKYWGEARSTGYGYTHVVVLRSECKKPQTCDVSTDVNPEVQKVPVSPGERKEVVTFLESPASAFTPRVSCK
jgi:hypothetical protein